MNEIIKVIKERKSKYGNSFPCISKKWSEYLGVDVSEEDVARMMALLKLCRLECCPDDADTKLDYDAYMWIADNMYTKYQSL